MSRLTPALCLTSALVLGACQEPVAAPLPDNAAPQAKGAALVPSEVRACDSGAVVATEGVATGQIKLTYKDRVMTLDQVPTGQGLHYRGEGADWTVISGDGEEVARLSLTTPQGQTTEVEQCRRPAPQLAETPKAGAMRPCISPDLAYGVEAGDAGMGHRLITIRVENQGRAACQLEGAPSVTLLDDKGQPLDKLKVETRTQGYFGAVQAAVPVLLDGGEKAYFDLGWSVMPNEAQGEKTCPQAQAVMLAPPGDNGGKGLDLAIGPCGGKLEVSPYRVVAARQAVSLPSS